MQDLKVTLIQTALAWEDRDANLEMFDRELDRIDQPTDLIVLPEMFTTGFTMRADEFAEEMEGETVAWLREKSQNLQADVVGSAIILEAGSFFNRLLWAKPDGRILTYDKRHLFRMAGEDKIYSAGDRLLTVELHGWKIRPFICYDLRFPVWTRNAGMAYDLAIFIANWPEKRAAHWRALLTARAIENQSFVVGVNRIGEDGNGYPHCGDSSVIDPQGNFLFHAKDRACTQTVALSRKSLDDSRHSFPAWQDADKFSTHTDNA